MRAVIWPKYGPAEVLQLKEVTTPVPGDDDVLIRVMAATVFAGDCEMRAFKFPLSFWLPLRLMFGLIRPKKRVQIPGQELAGIVEQVGRNITRFKPGDQVFGPLEQFGAYAEYACINGNNALAVKPANMTFEEAATVPVGGLNALHFVRKATIVRGDKVLINGAAGSIGTFAVQIARQFGAEVTAVDSTKKLAMLQSIGADKVIDYTKQDFTRNGETYSAIIDVVGKSPYGRSVASLTKTGRYVLGNPRFYSLFRGLWTSMTSSRKVIAALAGYRTKDLEFLRNLIETGKMKTHIDRRFTLEQIAEAHRYVETGQKVGHVVVQTEKNTLA